MVNPNEPLNYYHFFFNKSCQNNNINSRKKDYLREIIMLTLDIK